MRATGAQGDSLMIDALNLVSAKRYAEVGRPHDEWTRRDSDVEWATLAS